MLGALRWNNLVTYFSHYWNDLLLFPVWYYVYTLEFWYKSGIRTLYTVFDMFGVGPVLNNLFKPFRRDRTFVGYLIGFVIRFFWLLITSLIMAVTFSIVFAFVIFWYLGPIFLLTYRWQYIFPYFLFWFVYYAVYLVRRAYWKKVSTGNLTENLAAQIWRRLELDAKEIEPLYLHDKEGFVMYLKKHGLNEQDFLFTKEWVLRKELRKQSWQFWRDEFFVRRKGVNMGWAAGFLPELKRFSVDLTDRASTGHLAHVYGRGRELEKILTVLGRPSQNNILLVGEAGVGKTSLVYAIAWLILGRRVGFDVSLIEDLMRPLEGKRVIELNTGGMVGAGGGRLEALFTEVLRELREGETILFVNQIENLVQSGMISYLTPLLSSNSFPIIATTTPKVYRSALSKMAEFTTELEVIEINPPSVGETIKILEGVVTDMEAKNGVLFTYPALRSAAELTERYIHDKVLPDKAIRALVKAIEMATKRVIGIEEVQAAVSEMSGVPIGSLTSDESDKLLNLEQLLQQSIVGQEEAVREIARAIRRARTGVGAQDRPIASLLFLGNTGTGKTLSAKTLAQVYFTPHDGSVNETELNGLIEKSFIRFDMTEFSEYGAVPNFLERITKEVSQKPFSLVLLDEFEKANADIHNLFLQVFEDGRLSSSEGDTVDFRSTIIIATSNAVREIPDGTNKEQYIREALEKSFRPELINRFDGVVMFYPLSANQMKQVVILELNKLKKTLKKNHEIDIIWNDALVDELSKLGYDPTYGARPLRRVIQDRIEDNLAQKILRKELQLGDTYTLTVNDLQ